MVIITKQDFQQHLGMDASCSTSQHSLFFFFVFIHLFVFDCPGSLLLWCGSGAGFFQLRQVGATLCCGTRSSHCGGFSCYRAQALGLTGFNSCSTWALYLWLQSAGSVVVAIGLSCSAACGIFLDKGSHLCALHWQADFNPLCHQGSLQHTLTGSSEIFKSVRFS